MNTYFTFENLYKAYIDCRKRKGLSLYHMKFAENLEANLLGLEKRLQNRTYKPGRSIAFIVQKPKIREIFAADFRDRVVHHLLYNYLSLIFEKLFIYDSWACRKGKGTHRAMLRVQKFAGELEREREMSPRQDYCSSDRRESRTTGRNSSRPVASNNKEMVSKNSFYLQMDIKSFFTSIDQRILYDLIARKVKSEEILWLARTIIFHDCVRDVPPKIQSQPSLFNKLPRDKSLFTAAKGKGLPIGNLTSQFFANVYLNGLDQFVKHNFS